MQIKEMQTGQNTGQQTDTAQEKSSIREKSFLIYCSEMSIFQSLVKRKKKIIKEIEAAKKLRKINRTEYSTERKHTLVSFTEGKPTNLS